MGSHHVRFCQIAPLCNTDYVAKYVVVDKMQCATIEILGNLDYVCNFSNKNDVEPFHDRELERP